MKIFVLAVFISISIFSTAFGFEVKGRAVSDSFCAEGKCKTSLNEDEVIYEVNTGKSIIIRKALINKGVKDTPLGGLQSDNTICNIVYDQETTFANEKGETVTQRLIKAIGQTGVIDGFETIVIGEDFITTSRSTNDYFVIYYYKIIK